jgi:hypothetical protein
MNNKTRQFCPICLTEVHAYARYPRYVCSECYKKVCDENGRPLKFSNVSLSGGFVARYADTGEERDSHVCFIEGVRCWADEARFGGTVIEVEEESNGGSRG